MPGIDYEALAEENRRQAEEIAALKAKLNPPKTKADPYKTEWVPGLVFILVVVGVLFVAYAAQKHAPPPKPDCYFTDEKIDAEPWEPSWRVVKIGPRTLAGGATAAKGFKTKDEAWAFIQKWHLEACR